MPVLHWSQGFYALKVFQALFTRESPLANLDILEYCRDCLNSTNYSCKSAYAEAEVLALPVHPCLPVGEESRDTAYEQGQQVDF